MLIKSSRHRKEDLAVWADLEAADLEHGERLMKSGKVERALGVIERLARKRACYAATSWGKDSTVVTHLCRVAAPGVPVLHMRATNHRPDCDDVRDYYLRHFPGQAYHEVPIDYGTIHASGLPPYKRDRETDRLWYATIAAVRERFGPIGILGLRAAESEGRRVSILSDGPTTASTCRPIGLWSVQDVFGYLAVNGLPVHPTYACLGGGRWKRGDLRVAEIGDERGAGFGRREHEREYYGDVLRRLEAGRRP